VKHLGVRVRTDGLAGWLALTVAYPPPLSPKHTTLPVAVAPTPAPTARPALWDAGWLQRPCRVLRSASPLRFGLLPSVLYGGGAECCAALVMVF
jgi:hypothetical protein